MWLKKCIAEYSAYHGHYVCIVSFQCIICIILCVFQIHLCDDWPELFSGSWTFCGSCNNNLIDNHFSSEGPESFMIQRWIVPTI